LQIHHHHHQPIASTAGKRYKKQEYKKSILKICLSLDTRNKKSIIKNEQLLKPKLRKPTKDEKRVANIT